MKTYGKKIAKLAIQKQVRNKRETWDAILWRIDKGSKTAVVKIQGSNKLVQVGYHENLYQTPEHMKPGNAVRVTRIGGEKSKLEITGHGLCLPDTETIIEEQDTGPMSVLFRTGIISGLHIKAEESLGGMYVSISSGNFAINNTVYTAKTTSDIVMQSDSTMIMSSSSEKTMNTSLGVRELLPLIEIGQFRYDIFVIAKDGIIDYVPGTPANVPVMPLVPAEHVLIGWVLVVGGDNHIKQRYVNFTFVPRKISSLFANPIFLDHIVYVRLITDNETGEEETTYEQDLTNFTTVTMYDQYEKPLVGNYTVFVEKTSGLGELWINGAKIDGEGKKSIVNASSFICTLNILEQELLNPDIFSEMTMFSISLLDLNAISGIPIVFYLRFSMMNPTT